jgi:uncharacterized OB-fold protein
MPITERIDSAEKVHHWNDAIPFQYEYTAGVAGERFLRGLMQGRLVGGRCERCDVTFLPAKIYCVKCFGRIEKFVRVPLVGRVAAISGGGRRRREGDPARGFAFVTFEDVQGGLVHRTVAGSRLRIGSRARVKFRPKSERKGSILDIDGFEQA